MIVWLSRDVVEAAHDVQVTTHGGSPGLRDVGQLLAILDRPRNLIAHEDVDLAALAGCYAFGIATGHTISTHGRPSKKGLKVKNFWRQGHSSTPPVGVKMGPPEMSETVGGPQTQ